MAKAPAQNPNFKIEPDVFGKQLKVRKKGRFWKGLGITLLVVIGAGVAFGTFTQPGRDTVSVAQQFVPALITAKQNPDLLFENVGKELGNPNNSHVNILIIGQDRNWKIGKVYDPTTKTYRPYQVEDTDTRPRSDSMIVVSFDKIAQTVRLLSIPRDSRVTYRDFDGRRHRKVKLNSVYAMPRGDELLDKVFKDELGIRVDRQAVIKLDGFTKLIDRVGGIDINVEGALFSGKRTRMKYEDKWGGWKVDLMPGMQKLDGEQAHGYVRYRKDNEGDPGRVRRQQQVMRALVKKMMHVGPFDLPGMVTELQQQFETKMPNEEMVAAALFASKLGDTSKITPLTPYGVYADSDIVLNKPENVKLFKAIFGDSFDKDHFLVLSPETKGDDIGGRNNDNPAALPILREAGLIDADATVKPKAQIEAPGLQTQ